MYAAHLLTRKGGWCWRGDGAVQWGCLGGMGGGGAIQEGMVLSRQVGWCCPGAVVLSGGRGEVLSITESDIIIPPVNRMRAVITTIEL